MAFKLCGFEKMTKNSVSFCKKKHEQMIFGQSQNRNKPISR